MLKMTGFPTHVEYRGVARGSTSRRRRMRRPTTDMRKKTYSASPICCVSLVLLLRWRTPRRAWGGARGEGGERGES